MVASGTCRPRCQHVYMLLQQALPNRRVFIDTRSTNPDFPHAIGSTFWTNWNRSCRPYTNLQLQSFVSSSMPDQGYRSNGRCTGCTAPLFVWIELAVQTAEYQTQFARLVIPGRRESENNLLFPCANKWTTHDDAGATVQCQFVRAGNRDFVLETTEADREK